MGAVWGRRIERIGTMTTKNKLTESNMSENREERSNMINQNQNQNSVSSITQKGERLKLPRISVPQDTNSPKHINPLSERRTSVVLVLGNTLKKRLKKTE